MRNQGQLGGSGISYADPMWVAALNAAIREAETNRGEVLVWDRSANCAFYTNRGSTCYIEALGVTLHHGETLAVCWRQGDTAYSIEIFGAAQRA